MLVRPGSSRSPRLRPTSAASEESKYSRMAAMADALKACTLWELAPLRAPQPAPSRGPPAGHTGGGQQAMQPPGRRACRGSWHQLSTTLPALFRRGPCRRLSGRACELAGGGAGTAGATLNCAKCAQSSAAIGSCSFTLPTSQQQWQPYSRVCVKGCLCKVSPGVRCAAHQPGRQPSPMPYSHIEVPCTLSVQAQEQT